MSAETWLWVGFLGMAAGSAAILFLGKQRTAGEQTHTIIHGIVPIIAAISYFAMITGEGSVVIHMPGSVDTVKNIYFARYIDWAFTTPLLLTGLALTAMHGLRKRWGVIFGLIASDLIMILTALFFGLTSDLWTRWMWFVFSCGAFLAVYYGIWRQLADINRNAAPDAQKVFKSSAVFLSVVWFIYPIVLAFGTDGIGSIPPTETIAAITILDLVAKVVFGLKSTASGKMITDRDLDEQRHEAIE
jgi:bacteriorhodopsin